MSQDSLLENPFILAPMAGICDLPFRRLIKKMGAGCVVSEFVSAHGLLRGGKKFKKYLANSADEKPVGIQLFGHDSDIMAEAAKRVQDCGVDFVDINLGCPVPKVTKKGGGSAWLCYPKELGEMLATVKKAIDIPLTIKIRSGWDGETQNTQEIVDVAYNEGVHWVAIHGRTRAQGYAGSADWKIIEDVANRSKIPIIGNGDIISGPLAAARYLKSNCCGVMIARAALKNPWIFQEAVDYLAYLEAMGESERNLAVAEILQAHRAPDAGELPANRHYFQKGVKGLQPKPMEFFAKWSKIRSDRDPLLLIEWHLGFLRDFYPEERVEFAFKKFLGWYAAGYPGAHNFRKFIFTTSDFSAVLERALEFFNHIKSLGTEAVVKRDQAPVLMSGHG